MAEPRANCAWLRRRRPGVHSKRGVNMVGCVQTLASQVAVHLRVELMRREPVQGRQAADKSARVVTVLGLRPRAGRRVQPRQYVEMFRRE